MHPNVPTRRSKATRRWILRRHLWIPSIRAHHVSTGRLQGTAPGRTNVLGIVEAEFAVAWRGRQDAETVGRKGAALEKVVVGFRCILAADGSANIIAL